MMFWERVFQKYGLIILCFKTLEYFGKRCDINSRKKLRNVFGGQINWNLFDTDFCKLGNGKSRIVRSLSRREIHSTYIFVVFLNLDSANLKMCESYTSFLFPFDVSDGIKLRYR